MSKVRFLGLVMAAVVMSPNGWSKDLNAKSVQEGFAIVQRTTEASRLAAEASWNSACTQWRQIIEFLHPIGSLILVNCGNPQCPELAVDQHQCSSDGYYKYDDTLLPESVRPIKKFRKNSNRSTK